MLSNLWPLTFPWEKAIHRAFCDDKDPVAVTRYIFTITYGPTYYCNLTAAHIKEFIAGEIIRVSKKQTLRIHDKANNLTEYRQMLHSTYLFD